MTIFQSNPFLPAKGVDPQDKKKAPKKLKPGDYFYNEEFMDPDYGFHTDEPLDTGDDSSDDNWPNVNKKLNKPKGQGLNGGVSGGKRWWNWRPWGR